MKQIFKFTLRGLVAWALLVIVYSLADISRWLG